MATFDPTLLLNGLYEVKLTAYDRWNRASNPAISEVVVKGGLKVGPFTISFNDLTLPVAGMPISITRTYDSRAAQAGIKGDFGLGWTLSTSDIRLQKNGVVGGTENDPVWLQKRLPGLFPNYGVTPIRPRIVTITLPGGMVYSFRARLSPETQQAGRLQSSNVVWVAQSGTKGTLSSSDGDYVDVLDATASNQYGVVLWDENGLDLDQHNFTLTLPNGTRMELSEKGFGSNNPQQSLQSIRDLNGNVMSFAPNGISSTSSGGATKSVQFVRDSRGYITSIVDLKGKSVTYGINSNDDLVSFTDRESNSTTFDYGLNADGTQAPPHYLTQIRDALGKTPLANHYDANGRLDYSYVLNDPTKKIQYTHDLANGAEIVDNMGRKSSTSYDSYGNVTAHTKYLDDGNGTSRAITTSTEYGDPNNPDKPTKMTDALGRVTTMTYDVWGNVTIVTPPVGLQIETARTYSKDAIPSVVETWTRQLVGGVWTRVQRQSREEYDAKGRPVTSYDINNLKTTIEYSTSGVPIKVTKFADGVSYVTSSNVDSTTGNVISTTDANGQTTFFQYDANNQRVGTRSTRTRADGTKEDIVSRQILDNDGRVTRSERGVAPVGSWNASVLQASETVYNQIGKVESTTIAVGTPLARTTLHEYDDLGHDTLSTYSGGLTTQNRVNFFGELIQSRDHVGRITKYEYDSLGRQVKKTLCDAQGNPLLDGNSNPITTQSTYDDAGEVLASKDQRGGVTHYAYDAAGRKTDVWDALNSDPVSNPGFHHSVMHYDVNGRQDFTVDALGHQTDYQYDSAGRLVKTLLPLLDGQTSSTRSFTQTDYNDLGQVVKQTDAAGNWKGMTYDVLGRLKTVTVPVDSNSANNLVTTYGYDEMGHKTSQTDAKGHVTSFAYDSLGRMIGRTLPLGQSESTQYNVLGQVQSKIDFKGKTTIFTHDLRGRLLSKTPDASLNEAPVTFSYPDELTKIVTRGNQITTYKQDQNRGWLNSVTNSGIVNGVVSYSYDAGGNKLTTTSTTTKNGVTQSNTTTSRYDALSRVDKVTFNDQSTVQYSYDDVGNRQTVSKSNGISTLYTYDNQNRLISMQHAVGAGTSTAKILSRFAYTVRADGKRTGVREVVVNPNTTNANGVTLNTRTISYSFDLVGRLTQEKREERATLSDLTTRDQTTVTGYIYDAAGNRSSQTANTYMAIGTNATLVGTTSTTYNYNANDWLTDSTITVGNANTTTNYGYDANGAQTSVALNGTSTPYAYDFRGKLVSVGDTTSSTRSIYLYDGGGNRIQSIVASGGTSKTTNYLNDTNTAYVQVLEERDENGVLQARYDYGDGDLQKLSRLNTATSVYQTRWFLNDGLDSTRQLAEGNGSVTDSYGYDAFGNTAQKAGDTQNSRLFNGQQQDDTGLYFLRARYTNTSTGRFLSQDPVMGDDQTPSTLHRYSYCSGDPVNSVDPSGLYGRRANELGYLSHEAAEGDYRRVYANDREGRGGDYIFGRKTTGAGVDQKLKPDIFNYTRHHWADVKPWSPTGVNDAVRTWKKYNDNYSGEGYLPNMTFLRTPIVHSVTSDPDKPRNYPTFTTRIVLFNLRGIVFWKELTGRDDDDEDSDTVAVEEAQGQGTLQAAIDTLKTNNPNFALSGNDLPDISEVGTAVSAVDQGVSIFRALYESLSPAGYGIGTETVGTLDGLVVTAEAANTYQAEEIAADIILDLAA